MPLQLSTVATAPATANAILNTAVHQHRATTTWNGLVDVPPEPAQWLDGEGNHVYGTWVPVRTSRQREGMDDDEEAWTQVTHWSRQTVPETGAGERRLHQLLSNRAHMLAQAKRLTRASVDPVIIRALLTTDLAPTDIVQGAINAEPGNNALGVWNAILLGGPKAGPVHDVLAAAALAGSGLLLMDLILDDLSEADDLNAAIRVLADYQLVLDPAPANFGDLAFLLDRSEPRALEMIADWSDEEEEIDVATQPISCSFANFEPSADFPIGPAVLILPPPTPGGTPPLFVDHPANNRAEAELEISLQRAHLAAQQGTAGATVPIDGSLMPLDTLTAMGKTWKALRVTHRWPAGSAPETTELQLRAI